MHTINSTSDRRNFLLKISTLSAYGLIFNNEGLANSQTEGTSGVIIQANEGELRYIGNTRKAKVIIKISKSIESAAEMSLLSEELLPGDSIPEHKHLNEDEFLFVQKGDVQITLDGQISDGQPGDLIFVPKGIWHGFKNIGSEDLILLFGYSPAGFEDYFRAIGTTDPEIALNFSEEDWARTNKKYGIVYRG